MPLIWDWSETKAIDDEGFKEWLTKTRGGSPKCPECGEEFSEQPEGLKCPECGHNGIKIPMQYDLFTMIPMRAYQLDGGEYPKRGEEMLEGRVTEVNEELAKEIVDDIIPHADGNDREEFVENIIGLKVRAVR